ncbi:MAG: hypothetical protein CSA15_01520 [Candidatus Delongbacteria bacterium]|nr:MAG: hypothetical protein CSA15_01520 [Candidatus Delongbacteria bacterium]
MEIFQYNRIQLKKEIEKESFFRGERIPISKHRAISHINNPRANDEDILLIIAKEDSSLVGYIGVIPDYTYSGEERIKFGWISCWWIDENQRKSGIGAKLLLKLLKEYKFRICGVNFSPEAEKVFIATKMFNTLTKIENRNYIIRLDLLDLLKRKSYYVTYLKLPLKALDIFINSLYSIKRLNIRKKLTTKYEVIDRVDDKSYNFIRKYQPKNQFLRREKDELNWIISYPWIIERGEKNNEDLKYYFSSSSKQFKYKLLNIYDYNNELIGVTLLKLRDFNMSVPFSVYKPKSETIIAKTIIKESILNSIKIVTISDSKIKDEISNGLDISIKSWDRSKPIYYSKMIGIDKNRYSFQDGDGDSIFT